MERCPRAVQSPGPARLLLTFKSSGSVQFSVELTCQILCQNCPTSPTAVLSDPARPGMPVCTCLPAPA
eukprot:15467257-Alexandrium_andersonii.AAC.1